MAHADCCIFVAEQLFEFIPGNYATECEEVPEAAQTWTFRNGGADNQADRFGITDNHLFK